MNLSLADGSQTGAIQQAVRIEDDKDVYLKIIDTTDSYEADVAQFLHFHDPKVASDPANKSVPILELIRSVNWVYISVAIVCVAGPTRGVYRSRRHGPPAGICHPSKMWTPCVTSWFRPFRCACKRWPAAAPSYSTGLDLLPLPSHCPSGHFGWQPRVQNDRWAEALRFH
jgi:hypothetical protein